jgi:endonuclease/exonuclease/phosphatase family metal-dependent hydrolase
MKHARLARPSTPLARAGLGVLVVALALAPALAGSSAEAKAKKHHSSLPQFRAVTAPNTFFPVIGTKSVKDLHTYSKRHRGTDIKTACAATVRAATPGTAKVATNPAWGGRVLVRVVTNHNGLVTNYGWLWAAAVQDGQIVQAGQKLGILAGNPSTKRCTLYFSVTGAGHYVNPSTWLDKNVGKPVARWLFDTTGFTVASMNMLGASHTPSKRYPAYTTRTPKALAFLKARGVDVVGVQEFEARQAAMLLKDPTFRAFDGAYKGGKPDTRNAILWRNSTMEFVSGELLPIKYFNGSELKIPVVLLRQRATGRTAYFMNTHNPASNVFGYGNQSSYRNYDIGVEKAKIVQLRATGRPVIMTGDFNDRQAAFCPMTADKLTISPNSIPSMTCAYPKQSSIDWIFAAGQARFSTYSYDRSAKDAKVTDHPVILARAHLQD